MNQNLQEELLRLKQEKLILREELAIRQAHKDFPFFLKAFVYTLNEHNFEQPVSRFPSHKEYLMDLAQILPHEPLLLIEKSRQMLVTWTCIAYCVWVATCFEGRRVFIQSKKEKDADDLVSRGKFIYEHLPERFRQRHPAAPYSYLTLKFPQQNSIIQGTPQGADVLRQYTASLIFSDELAFQEKAEEAYIAAKPTITGGGQFIGVSSPNFKEFFYLLKSDKI